MPSPLIRLGAACREIYEWYVANAGKHPMTIFESLQFQVYVGVLDRGWGRHPRVALTPAAQADCVATLTAMLTVRLLYS